MPSQECWDKSFPDPAVYDVRINEFQRGVLQLALQEFIANNIGSSKHPFVTVEVATSMEDMLNPQGSVGPLATNGINSFVL